MFVFFKSTQAMRSNQAIVNKHPLDMAGMHHNALGGLACRGGQMEGKTFFF